MIHEEPTPYMNLNENYTSHNVVSKPPKAKITSRSNVAVGNYSSS